MLQKSEIRSARAIRSTVSNNIVYNEKGLERIVVENDKADGVTFKNNIIKLMDEEVVQKFDRREGSADQFYSDPE